MRDKKELLRDIIDAIASIQRYSARGRDCLESDELIQIQMVYHFRIIGEAAAQLGGTFMLLILQRRGRRL